MDNKSTTEILRPRLKREKKTISAMIKIYCNDKHSTKKNELCEDCTEMQEYTHKRLKHCRYQEHKPTCGNCPKHCYNPSMKERVMDVMRYSGPRMTYKHPVLAIQHLFDGFKKTPEIKKKVKDFAKVKD